jgi:hypothetical protein
VEADSSFYVEKNGFDGWVSRSFPISERQSFGVGSRYVNQHYFRRPEVFRDTNETFHNRQTYVASIFLSKINFFKARNIYAFNITEDVPVGIIYSLVFGPNWNEFENQFYTGIRVGASAFTGLGYLSGDLQAGNFFAAGNSENTILNLKLSYFTPIVPIGVINNRTFINSNLFLSNELSFPISRSLEGNEGIRDISGTTLSGNQLLSGSIESVFFMPYYFLGFQFAPFAFTDFGIVIEDRTADPYEKFYNNIGMGLRTKNENLVFNALEFRAAYFPNTPEDGDSFVFKIKFTSQRIFNPPNVTRPNILAFD